MNNSSAPIIEDWNSDDESEVEPNDKTVRPSTEKEKSNKTVRETDTPKQNKHHLEGTKETGTILCKSVQEEEHDPRVDDLEELIHQVFDTGNDDVSPVREATDVDDPSGSRTPDREWNQTKTIDDRPPQQ
ncbi:hypothetical protein Tco_1137047 [Tanacetum coccineum]